MAWITMTHLRELMAKDTLIDIQLLGGKECCRVCKCELKTEGTGREYLYCHQCGQHLRRIIQ